MRAGPLRHRCSLQSQQRTEDGAGGYIEGWQEYANVWGEINSISGRTAQIAQQLDGEITAEINVRYREDVKRGDRLVHQSTTYEIKAPLPDNRTRLLKLLCTTIENP